MLSKKSFWVIVLVALVGIFLLARINGKKTTPVVGTTKKTLSREDSLRLAALRDSVAQNNQQRAIDDSLYRNSKQYKLDEKKRLALQTKFEKVVESCYQNTKVSRRGGYERTFNLTKFEDIMENTYKFSRGQYTGHYSGVYQGHLVSIRMGQATPSSNGWVHNWTYSVQRVK